VSSTGPVAVSFASGTFSALGSALCVAFKDFVSSLILWGLQRGVDRNPEAPILQMSQHVSRFKRPFEIAAPSYSCSLNKKSIPDLLSTRLCL
jgi:hypothetical protein